MLKADGVFNRDMQPSANLIQAFPRLEPVLDNRAVWQAFLIHERSAVRWKFVHGLLGRTALLCLLMGMAFFDYELTLSPLYHVTKIAPLAAAVLAGTGVACQLAMILGKTKERWLIERFAAERLRGIKFHAFAMVVECETPAQLAARVAQFTTEAIARLDQQLMGGRAALTGFSPSELSISVHASAARCPDLIRDAYKTYVSTRLEVQVQHFESQSALSDKRSRVWAFLSEIAFAMGGILAFIQLCNAVANGFARIGASRSVLWLEFIALLLFIGSAVLAVYQRGASHTPDAERYKHYTRELRLLRTQIEPKSAEDFLHLVEQTEQIEARELFEFCRDAAHSSYIF